MNNSPWTADGLATPQSSTVADIVLTYDAVFRLVHDQQPNRWYATRTQDGRLDRTVIYGRRTAPALTILWTRLQGEASGFPPTDPPADTIRAVDLAARAGLRPRWKYVRNRHRPLRLDGGPGRPCGVIEVDPTSGRILRAVLVAIDGAPFQVIEGPAAVLDTLTHLAHQDLP